MDTSEQRYLRAISRYLAGPLQAAVEENKATRQMPAVLRSILLRLAAGTESGLPDQRSLRTVAENVIAEFERLPPAYGSGPSALKQLREALKEGPPSSTSLQSLLTELCIGLAVLNDPHSVALQRRLLNEEWLRIDAIETTYQSLLADPAGEVVDVGNSGLNQTQRHALVTLLQDTCGEAADLNIDACTVVLGGLSKQTLLVDLRNNCQLPTGIVVRLDRPESATDMTVRAEFPLLQLLFDKGVKVPKPWALDEGTVTGRPLMVVSRVAGKTIGDGHHVSDKSGGAKIVASLATELAKIHAIPVADLPSSIPRSHADNVSAMSSDLEHLRQVWNSSGRSSPIVEASFKWLQDHLHHAGAERSLIHCDMRFHNILVDADAVASILDWELARIGNPGFDLAYAYHHVSQLAAWDCFLDAYRSAGGTVPPRATLNFYALRAELFALVYLTRLETGFLSGAFEKIDLVYAGINLRQHNLYLLAKRLMAILAGQNLGAV